jgi:acyl-coenzyme A thioesterase PaaI-like protein
MPAPSEASDHELTFPDLGCFGCSPSNPAGLALRFRRAGDTVYAAYTIPERFHGAPGIAHGGVLATIVDEVSCAAVAFLRASFVVTGELSVRYLRPCPVDVPLVIEARIAGEHPRYLVVDAEVRQGDLVLARSTGKFFPESRTESAP